MGDIHFKNSDNMVCPPWSMPYSAVLFIPNGLGGQRFPKRNVPGGVVHTIESDYAALPAKESVSLCGFVHTKRPCSVVSLYSVAHTANFRIFMLPNSRRVVRLYF